MGQIERYMAYAAAFEEAYASDDWSKLELFAHIGKWMEAVG